MTDILIVEDDKELADLLTDFLREEGYVVSSVNSGERAVHLFERYGARLVVLDINLPDMNGFAICSKLRENTDTPILIVSSRTGREDKLNGYDLGADDYLVKPFDFEELMARIRCIFRRPRKLESFDILNLGNTSYYIHENKLSCGSKNCSLSKREGALMEIFFKNASQVLPRELLLSKVWGIESDVEMGNLDNYIHFLRRRLKTVDSSLSIQTIRGIGFSMEERGKGGKDS